MNQTVYSAQVNECAERRKRLNSTCVLLADFCVSPKLFSLFLFKLFYKRNSVLFFVKLFNIYINLVTDFYGFGRM